MSLYWFKSYLVCYQFVFFTFHFNKNKINLRIVGILENCYIKRNNTACYIENNTTPKTFNNSMIKKSLNYLRLNYFFNYIDGLSHP